MIVLCHIPTKIAIYNEIKQQQQQNRKRWKRDENGRFVLGEVSGKRVLEFVAIRRRDTSEWAIPGGMIDPGEIVTKTLIREFSEEALSKNLIFDQQGQIVKNDEVERQLVEFFRNGTQVTMPNILLIYFNWKQQQKKKSTQQ